MLFTSLDFFLFLPLALAGFAVLPARVRWAWLLAASWLFYGASSPRHLAWLGAVTALVVVAGRQVAGRAPGAARNAWFAASVALLVGALGFFKFAVDKGPWAAPAGFSFYVFSALSYLADARRGLLPAGVRAGEAAMYLAWFPKLLAGPIERAPGLLALARVGARASPQQVVFGFQLVLWGLVKKVVIADNIAPLVDRPFGMVAYASPLDLLVGAYLFAIQIYCDFSGYTDIARGVSLWFGLPLAENFRRPYFARSIGEFWGARWHVTLGRWFRDYVYVPLGGSRAGTARACLNVMIVFALSGLWHAGLGYGVGWTFLAWGALHGAYRCAALLTAPAWERAGDALPAVAASRTWALLRILLTFHLVLLGWVLFRAKTIPDAWLLVTRVAAAAERLPELALRYPWSQAHVTALVLVVMLFAIEWLDERRPLSERLAAAPAWLRWAAAYAAIGLLLVLGKWQSREFIYMQF